LPGFLVGDRANRVPPADVRDGFALAGHFLLRDLFAPRGLALPDAHEAYIAMLAKRDVE
jgi:DNA repair protein RecO (recombination protein O)